MRLFLAEYKKYSSDVDSRKVHIIAGSLEVAAKKAKQIVRKNWADRVVLVREEMSSVEVA